MVDPEHAKVRACACCMRRKEEAASLGLKAAVPGETAEDALAVTAPLAIACWCAYTFTPCLGSALLLLGT